MLWALESKSRNAFSMQSLPLSSDNVPGAVEDFPSRWFIIRA